MQSTYNLDKYYATLIGNFEKKHGIITQLAYKVDEHKTMAYYASHHASTTVPRRLFLVLGGNAELGLDSLWIADRALSASFADCAFVSVDYPSYGRSEGTMGERQATEAANGALEAVRVKLGVAALPPTTIIAHSLGCAVALRVAAFGAFGAFDSVDSLILSSPFESIAAMAQHMFTPSVLRGNERVRFVLDQYLIKRENRWNNLQSLDALAERAKRRGKPYKIVVMHSREDAIIPFALGEAVFAKAQALHPHLLASFAPRDTGDHNSVLDVAWDRVVLAMNEFARDVAKL